jgi:hypothetical protein
VFDLKTYGTVIQRTARLAMWIGLVALTCFLTGWIILEHYLSLRSGYEIAGYETMKLVKDPLVGPYLSAYIPDATLPAALAISLAIGEVVLFGFAIHQVFRLIDGARSLHYWRGSMEEGHDTEQRAATWVIIEFVFWFTGLFLLVVPVVKLDIASTEFRSFAGVMRIEDPDLATQIRTWDRIEPEAGGIFPYELARLTAVAYIALVFAACAFLEFSVRQTGERFVSVIDAADVMINGPEYPEDEDADTGFDEPEDTDGEDQDTFDENASEPVRLNDAAAADSTPREPAQTTSRRESGSTGEHRATQSARDAKGGDLREVIGSNPPRHVSLADALADESNYVVVKSTGDVWDRTYWDDVNGPGSEGETPLHFSEEEAYR